jgi:hypothetical protein
MNLQKKFFPAGFSGDIAKSGYGIRQIQAAPERRHHRAISVPAEIFRAVREKI